MKRKHYTNEEKQSIMAKYATSSKQLKDFIVDEGIPKSTFTQWLREYNQQHSKDIYSFTPLNFKHMIKRNKHLEDIISVLQASYCTPNATLRERLDEAERLYPQYNVHLVCEALKISRGTFYNHIKRNKREKAWFFLRREELKPKIEKIFNDSNQTYGVRKVTAKLKTEGVCVSPTLVRELMRELGLINVRSYSKYVYNKELSQYKNYVSQFFEADAPNKTWASDITYFRVKDNPYYICAILDLFSRKVIAYSIGKSNTSYLVKRTVRQAYNDRCPAGNLIFHSDRGSNYRSEAVRKLLISLGITQSFSKPHTPYDNAVMETFFATLKQEELYRMRYRSEREFKESVKSYINFYNNERLHETLGYIPPSKYEHDYFEKIKA